VEMFAGRAGKGDQLAGSYGRGFLGKALTRILFAKDEYNEPDHFPKLIINELQNDRAAEL